MSSPLTADNLSADIETESPEEFLTPEQREAALVEILAAITTRIIKKRHE